MISKNQMLRKRTQNEPKRTQNKPNHKKAKNERNFFITNDLRPATNDSRSAKQTQTNPKQTQFFSAIAKRTKVIPPTQGKYPVLRLHKSIQSSIKGAMVKVEFAQDQAPIFEGAGLKSFEDFFAYAGGQIVGTNDKREVVAMRLEAGGGEKEFFMKRFFRPHFKDMLFTIRNFGKLCSQAGCEWKNIDILLRQGVATYRPVCYGEQMRAGLENKSFIVTRKIEGLAMTDFVGDNWSSLTQPQKEKIVATLARFVRKIHNAKISLPDLYLWHIFITKAPPTDEITEDDFAVIDLHRMRINVTNQNTRIKDLGALDFSMSDKYFDEGIREVFLDAYINTVGRDGKNSVLRKIRNRSQKLSCRRRKPNY